MKKQITEKRHSRKNEIRVTQLLIVEINCSTQKDNLSLRCLQDICRSLTEHAAK